MVGLAAIGVGAWAAYGFLTTGPQPAEALPAGTLGYVSIDLDPSGGQKIEALRTLNKFPAFEDEVGIDTDDDIRKAIFDKIQDEAKCDGLDYGDDIEPWLGDRAAIAAVDVGGDNPDPVFVLQVKDADAAEKGLDAIKDCGSGGEDATVGWTHRRRLGGHRRDRRDRRQGRRRDQEGLAGRRRRLPALDRRGR